MALSSVPNIVGTGGGGGGGTVTQGTPGSLANAWPVKVTDGVSILGTPANPLATSNLTTSSTATLSSVLNSAATFVILALNLNRRGLFLYNDSTTTTNIAFAATASNTAFTLVLTAKSSYSMDAPIYQGAISGIAAAANGSIRITEFT